jgi:RNA polymerase sigma factor (sigma-70 family)
MASWSRIEPDRSAHEVYETEFKFVTGPEKGWYFGWRLCQSIYQVPRTRLVVARIPTNISIPNFADPEGPDVAPARPERTIVGRLFSDHGKRIRRLLSFRLRSEAEAQDATQDVFLRLWQHEQQGTLRPQARSYLFSAVYTKAVDVERHRIVVEQDLDRSADPDSLGGEAPTQEDGEHWRRAMATLIESLKSLPERPREAFVLYHFHNLGYDEVAERMGVARRSVQRYLAEALAHCRKDLESFL